MCELNPCLFGECKLTASSFRCHCKPGYYGDTCDLRHRPCSSNPCEARGECVETNDASFKCNCHAWWEGQQKMYSGNMMISVRSFLINWDVGYSKMEHLFFNRKPM